MAKHIAKQHNKAMLVPVLALLAVLGLLAPRPLLANDAGTSQGVIEKVADLPTDYAEHMHEPNDTSMLGRIITDKTVRNVGFDAIDRQTGEPINPADIGDNFTVTFSALSSGGEVPGEGNSVPVDVVLVLDTSNSMTTTVSSGTTRAAAMVRAANEAIKMLMESNPENRVAVVTYGTTATTMIPLQSLNNISGEYLTISNPSATTNVIVSPNSAIAGGTQVKINGATNTEAGIYFGMNELLAANPQVTIAGKEYSRIPGVILMSDGVASVLNDNASWWSLSSSDSRQSAGAENDRYWGNGYVAMLEASYMKNKVANHYSTENCSIYTVGLGVGSSLNNNIGRLILDPTHALDNTSWTSSHNAPKLMRDAFDNFLSNKTSSVPYARQTSSTNYNYTVQVPSGAAAAFNPTSLKYNEDYYSADDVDELIDAFKQSIETLSLQAYDPTATDPGDETGELSGHVTFTDALGTFMEVKDFKSILWVDHDPNSSTYGERIEFTEHSKSSSETTDTYVFSGSTHSSWRYNYEQVPLSDIIITVDKSGLSDVVTIQIPPALLPMVEYTVKADGDTVTEAWRNEETAPIKINYEVGPKEGIVGYIAGTSDGSELDAALKSELDGYLVDDNNYVNTDNGRGVALYTNAMSGSSVPAASFEINSANSYYSFTQKTPLFSDASGQNPATEFVAGTTYYYKKNVYTVSNDQSVVPEQSTIEQYLPVTSLTSNDVVVENGQLFAKAYSEKDLPTGENKQYNHTETLPYRYTSRWFDGTKILQSQGNNGRLVIERPGNLQLEKVVSLADGLDASGVALDEAAINSKKFTFNVELDVPITSEDTTSYSALTGTYDYVISNPNIAESQWETGTIADGRASVQLTQEETLLIKNLPDGTRYTLSEVAAQPGYTLISSTTTYLDEDGASQTVDGTRAGGYQLVGYVASSSTSTASFTNEYGFNPEGINIANRPHVKKTLDNTTFDDNNYQFFMTITPYDDNPADVELASTQVEVNLDAVGRGEATQLDANNIDSFFQGITFHAPGTYWFRIAERNNAIPGITYSQSVYAYVVNVHDNGDGTMSINTDVTAQNPDITMQKVIDIDGTSVPAGVGTIEPARVDGQDVLEATFTNTYSVEEITIGTPGLKTYTDNSGTKPLEADMFQFEIRPSFYDANGDPLTQEQVDAVPMPEGTSSERYTEGDTGTELRYTKKDTFNAASGDFGFGTITFDLSDVGNSYRYVVQEIIPNEALVSGTRHYVNRNDSSDTVDTSDDHGYLWHDGAKIYDLKTITYQGMVYDCSRHVVVVDVTQETTDGITHIVADVQYQTSESAGMQEVVINNVYTPDPAVTGDDSSTGNNISVKKTLRGRDSADNEDFTFQISAAGVNSRDGLANDTIIFNGDTEATTMQASTSETLSNGVAQEIFFNNITFKRAGTYTFAICEVVPESSERSVGVVYDQHTANVIVVVALDEDQGKLYIESVTPTAEGATTFTNTYSAEPVEFGSVGALEIGKLVDGRAMVARKYSFTVAATNEDAKAKNEAAGLDETITVLNSSAAADGVEQETATLQNLSFTLDDVGKTFTYKISEVVPAGANVDRKFEGITYAYDGLIDQYLTYEVADNGDGSLTVTTTVKDGDGSEAETLGSFTSTSGDINPATVHFKNKYAIEPVEFDASSMAFSKSIEGREWKEGDTFNFTLTKSPSNAPEPERTSASLSYEQVQEGTTTFDFGSITFTQPGTYTYTVVEDQEQGSGDGITNDTAARSFRVVVTDNNVGGLEARAEAIGSLIFVNTYEATQDFVGVDVSKTLMGRSMREREFMVDIRPIDVEGGDDDTTYATAEETAAVFGVREHGETVVINRPQEGSTQVENIIPALTLTEAQAGTIYAFEVKEFVPRYAEDANLNGATYKMRDGVYYNTLGENFNHWRIEIEVADDTNGNLTTTVTWIAHDENHNEVATVDGGSETNPESAPVIPFENTYQASGTATINTIKDLEGREWNDSDTFEFTIARMKLSADGNALEEDDGSLATPLPEGTLTAKSDTDAVGSDGTQHHAVRNPDDGASEYKNGWLLNISQEDLTVDPTDNIKKGDFYYKIYEVLPEDDDVETDGVQKAGVTYSQTPRYVHVHAEDTRTGAISTTVEYVDANAPNVSLGATPVFTNRYNPSGEIGADTVTAELKATKTIDTRNFNANDTFRFMITADDKTPMPANTVVTIDGLDTSAKTHTFSFGDVVYTFADLGGESEKIYTYTIVETAANQSGITYDESTQKLYVKLSQTAEGALSVEYSTDGSAYAADVTSFVWPRFANTYAASGSFAPEVQKELQGSDLKSGQFTFEIEAVTNGAPVPADAKAENKADGSVKFGSIAYSLDDAGKTYEYTIREVLPEGVSPDSPTKDVWAYDENSGTSVKNRWTYDTHELILKVTVTDNGDGTVKAEGTYEDGATFTNSVSKVPEETIEISATKRWDDTDPSLRSDVTLHLYGRVDGKIAYEGETKTIAKNATGSDLTVSWGNAPVKLNDKDVSYEVVEDAVVGYTSSVTGNAEDGFMVTNTLSEPTTTITATKVWDDADNVDNLREAVQFKLVRTVEGGEPEDVETSEAFSDAGHVVIWSDLPATLPQEDSQSGELKDVAVLYSVEEVGTPSDYEAVVVAIAPGEFEVRNVHVPETIGDVDGPTDPTDSNFEGIKATKVWSDNENADGNRPGFAVLTLQQRKAGTGDDAWTDYSDPKAAVEANGWQVGWTGLSKNASAGVPYEYRVVEKQSDTPNGYSSTVSGDAAEGFVVTNTFNAKQEVAATKTWYEEDGITEITPAPEAATLHLKKRVGDYEETEVASATIPASASGDNLTVTWSDLPTTEHGLQVVYFVTEDEVEGYTTSVDDGTMEDSTLSIRVTNTKKAEEPPEPASAITLVSFIDPLNAAGDQVLKFQGTSPEELDNSFDTLKPANPDHTANSKTFQQWDKNESKTVLADGTTATLVTYVARFTDTTAGTKTVSYVNGQAAGTEDDPILVKTEATTDPSTVEAPTATPKGKNMVFVGWEGPVEDAMGNLVYVAKFAADSKDTPAPAADTSNSTKTYTEDGHSGEHKSGNYNANANGYSGTNLNGKASALTPDTGDPALSLYSAALVAVTLVFAGLIMRRKKGAS